MSGKPAISESLARFTPDPSEQTDAEGDSRMHSSSEASSDDLNAMFPEANEPADAARTPPSSNIQNLQRFSELSPPASEGPADYQTSGRYFTDPTNGADGSIPAENLGGGGFMGGSQQQLSIAEREPGASWNTRKHQDEETRVKEQLLDRGFSLSEFGDIYNDKDMSDEV
ncbi:MAG: hypothetical protein L6R35_007020 [Caloplaca aegaea]|nr:MAG: hypothetical protein L6R35_007020 [Caloplaca aegaea]